MAAAVVDNSDLELDEQEAQKLADAVEAVGQYYSVAFDPKKLAIFNLIQCVGVIYGTRVVAMMRKRKTIPATAEPARPAPAPAPRPHTGGIPTDRALDLPLGMNPSQIWPESGEIKGASF